MNPTQESDWSTTISDWHRARSHAYHLPCHTSIMYTLLYSIHCLSFLPLIIYCHHSIIIQKVFQQQPAMSRNHTSFIVIKAKSWQKQSLSFLVSIHPFIVVGDGYTLQLFLCSRYKDTEFPSIILCWCQVIPVMQVMIKAVGDKFTCLNAGTVICHPAIA